MRKKIIITTFITLIFVCTGLFVYFQFFQKKEEIPSDKNITQNALGTWWWSKSLDVEDYLQFAKQKGVTEIYYCDYSFSDNVANFVEKVCKNNIKVYLLAGEKEWLEDRNGLDVLIEKYIQFQNNHQYKFSGIHLDIEPHQFSNFSENRANYLYLLVDLIKTNKNKYNQISFDYDIPFWLDDEIEFDGVLKETYKHIIDFADRVFIMSYRDTSEKMFEVSADEISYAKEKHKTLFLSAETYSEEGNKVSYYEEGELYMHNELEKLRNLLPENFGIAIHNIKTWKALKD